MTKITAEYKGELRCEVHHDASGAILMTDAPKDNHGKGEGFSPTDLVGASLITCIATLMGIQAKALKLDISGMTLTATKEMASDKPRRIAKLICTISVPGHMEDRQKELLRNAAMTCPVYHSLSPEIEKIVNFNWSEEV